MPMMNCPECRHEVNVPDRYVGRWWRCPDCRAGFRPPTPEEAAERTQKMLAAKQPTAGTVRRALERFVKLLKGK